MIYGNENVSSTENWNLFEKIKQTQKPKLVNSRKWDPIHSTMKRKKEIIL